ncbi:MAG: MFS transporter [Ignavibacteria bacterium]|jgi:MFS family permease
MSATKLLNKNFLLLWQGQTVSQIGAQIFSIALMFWIKHETGSATLMGLVMTVSMLPAALLGPISGAIVDNLPRKKMIITADVINGMFSILLSAIVYFSLLPVDTTIVVIFVMSTISGILFSIFNPAITSSIPDLVPEDKLQAANSMQESIHQLSLFIGQALGGIFYTLFGAPLLFLFDGITYLFSAGSESFIDFPKREIKKHATVKETFEHYKKETLEGIKYVWDEKGIRFIFLSFAVLTFFIMPFIVLLPFYVEDTLGLNPSWYGYIFGAFGLGSILGYGASGILNPKGKFRVISVLTAFVIVGGLMPLFGIILNEYVAIVLMLIIGMADGYFTVNIITVLQLKIKPEMRGRVFAVLNSLSLGLAPASMALAGVTADLLNQNIPPIFIFCGVFTFITCLASALSKHYREFLGN